MDRSGRSPARQHRESHAVDDSSTSKSCAALDGSIGIEWKCEATDVRPGFAGAIYSAHLQGSEKRTIAMAQENLSCIAYAEELETFQWGLPTTQWPRVKLHCEGVAKSENAEPPPSRH